MTKIKSNTKKRPLITDYFSMSAKRRKETTDNEQAKTVEARPNSNQVLQENTPSSIDEEPLATTDTLDKEQDDVICKRYNFNKSHWIKSLSADQRQLLQLEIDTLETTWLAALHQELTKPYFLKLKQFLAAQYAQQKTIFPPPEKIYSWSHLTPLPRVKCLILGQDPYHNHKQAHGLAFSVQEPTKPPPSLVNIYKTLAIDFPGEFKTIPKSGDLTKWAQQGGVLMLNAVLTVEAHKANSHARQGWESFTEEVIRQALLFNSDGDDANAGFVIMAWGSPAQKRVEKFATLLSCARDRFLLVKCVHPSPLSAHRGFFTSGCFKACNDWLVSRGRGAIDWTLADDEAGTKK
ncbi:uncharacterized protein LODBEIA_P34780 [Lodderomyces beijingensis]|uniref:Uracil-DNA glycosylase n=1 Tax=Lodderomyces beijingensis TaxID=1775926 RepID=A0ABP0ZM89_9ASCO